MTERIPVTIVNHLALDIAATPDALWDRLIDGYIRATGFKAQGTVETIDDPSAPLGGYRMRMEADGFIDERIILITERNDDARRLSLTADYLTMPGNIKVHATYQAQVIPGGTRFVLDCHTPMRIEAPEGSSREAVAAIISKTRDEYHTAMLGSFGAMKAKLEAAA